MAGDKVDLGVQYYYNSMTNTNGPSLSTSDLLNSLASGLVSIAGATHGTFATLDNTSTSPLLAALTSSIGNETGTGTSKPQAYLNWVLLDNQFNYVSGSSGALQVGAAGTQSNGALQSPLAMTGIPMTKSGFLYIYVSNATPGWDVFFDNLSAKTYSGPMVEENHYYPFGLSMAGISDKAIKTQYAINKYRYGGKELQSQEFADASGLEEYDFGARYLDPQLGVWHGIDPLADATPDFSPYTYCYNNPLLYVDPTGMEGEDGNGGDNDQVRVKYSYNKKTHEVTTQQVSESEYQKNTNGGTTNLVQGDQNGGGQLVFQYQRVDGTGAYVDPTYEGTNSDDSYLRNDKYTYVGATFRHVVKDDDGGNKGLDIANTTIGAFSVGWGMKQEMMDFAVRDRAGLPRSAFNELSTAEKETAEIAALGRAGSKYLKFVKGVGWITAGASVVITGATTYNYYHNGGKSASVGIKAGMDVVMTAVGFFGPIGFGISAAYFLVDACTDHFGGFGDPEKN